MRNNKKFKTFGVLRKFASSLILISFIASPLNAKELRMASGVPPMHPAHAPLYTEFKELVSEETDGDLTGILLGPEVTTLRNMRTSIQSGVVQIGLYLSTYFPSELKDTNLIGNLSLLGIGANAYVIGAAVTEYNLTCPDCQEQLGEQGMTTLASHAISYNLLSTTPVRDLEDMQGLRFSVGSPQLARWVESVGGTPVSMPMSERFEAISQGTIDGTINSVAELEGSNLAEVITHVTLLDLGTFHPVLSHTMKRQTWSEFTVPQRHAVLKSSIEANNRAARRWIEMRDSGRLLEDITFIEPSEDLRTATAEFVKADLDTVARDALEDFGIAQANEKIAQFQKLVEKWDQKISEIDDPDKVSNLIYKELLANPKFVENYSL